MNEFIKACIDTGVIQFGDFEKMINGVATKVPYKFNEEIFEDGSLSKDISIHLNLVNLLKEREIIFNKIIYSSVKNHPNEIFLSLVNHYSSEDIESPSKVLIIDSNLFNMEASIISTRELGEVPIAAIVPFDSKELNCEGKTDVQELSLKYNIPVFSLCDIRDILYYLNCIEDIKNHNSVIEHYNKYCKPKIEEFPKSDKTDLNGFELCAEADKEIIKTFNSIFRKERHLKKILGPFRNILPKTFHNKVDQKKNIEDCSIEEWRKNIEIALFGMSRENIIAFKPEDTGIIDYLVFLGKPDIDFSKKINYELIRGRIKELASNVDFKVLLENNQPQQDKKLGYTPNIVIEFEEDVSNPIHTVLKNLTERTKQTGENSDELQKLIDDTAKRGKKNAIKAFEEYIIVLKNNDIKGYEKNDVKLTEEAKNFISILIVENELKINKTNSKKKEKKVTNENRLFKLYR